MTQHYYTKMNTWPKGERHALTQNNHSKWNTTNYPGTRQLCIECHEATDRCEEDAIYTDSGYGPLCIECLENNSIGES